MVHSILLSIAYTFENIFDKTFVEYPLCENGNFLSPHNHLTQNYSESNKKTKVFSVAYYIDDGDPDVNQTYSGCITFMNNNSLIHIRPQTGTLLIWEDYLVHLVNPFYSKSNKERFMLSTNIMVTL